MLGLIRGSLLLLGSIALAGATTINFDDLNTSGGNVSLNSQYAGVTFDTVPNGSSGCTGSSGCGFVARQDTTGGVIVPSSPNYAAVSGNAGVNVFIDFAAPAEVNSIDLLGLTGGGGGFYDGATITFLDSSNAAIGAPVVINPVGPSGSTIGTSTMTFNVSNVSHIEISKVQNNNGAALFGFDNLVYTSSVPEPASMLMIGGGLGLLGLALRRRKA